MQPRTSSDDARVALIAASLLLWAQAAAWLGRGPSSGAPRFAPHRVDLDAASEGEIEALPGVGPVLAARIVAERERAPFASLDDLTRVLGVGAATIERLRGFANCGGR